MKKIILAILLFILSGFYFEAKLQPAHECNLKLNYYTSAQRTIDFAKTDPIAFLELLKAAGDGAVFISKPPDDWIKAEHIPYLLELIDSKTPTAFVICERSSNWPLGESSTIGNEAMFLIEGFKRKRYPPFSTTSQGFKGNPDEYRVWWQERIDKKNGESSQEARDKN